MITCPACGHEAETPFKFCPECGAPAESPARAHEQRKVVTVLFCDITVALGAQTEMLTSTADAFTDLGEVLRLAGKDDEAKAALDEAIARYERKGNVVGVRRARALAGYEALAGR